MKQNNKYSITNFYVGELYLYIAFANLMAGNSIKEDYEKVKKFSQTGAICFQKDQLSKYVDWETKREYTGFLTIFYQEGDKLICLHNGNIYELEKGYIIDNLVPLQELLPKIDYNQISKININEALKLFDILFKTNENTLYSENKQTMTDFFVGDLTLKETYQKEEFTDSRKQYIDLPQHQMLNKSNLAIYSYEDEGYISTVYRCLFLRDGVDLYNTNNSQFYNHNEDRLENIMSFTEYLEQFEINAPQKETSIPKALKLFKKTI